MSECKHDRNVLLCSCGYSRETKKPKLSNWEFPILSKEEIIQHWKGWGQAMRDFYEDCLDVFKPYEEREREAASFAVSVTENWGSVEPLYKKRGGQ